MQETFDVLVLAGGELGEDLKPFSDDSSVGKAMLKVAGKRLIEYTVDALRGVKGLNRILVVGPEPQLEPVIGDRVWKILPPAEGMLDNLRIGLDALGQDGKLLLVSTCDIPLVDSAMLRRFLDECAKSDADIYYPVISKAQNDAKYPATKRTYARLREGVYTGGNVVLMRPEIFNNNLPLIEQTIAARKSPLKLLRIIGFGFLVLFLFRRLTIEALERKIGSILGMRAKCVPVADPEIGIDVDKASDVELVRNLLESGAAATK